MTDDQKESPVKMPSGHMRSILTTQPSILRLRNIQIATIIHNRTPTPNEPKDQCSAVCKFMILL